MPVQIGYKIEQQLNNMTLTTTIYMHYQQLLYILYLFNKHGNIQIKYYSFFSFMGQSHEIFLLNSCVSFKFQY